MLYMAVFTCIGHTFLFLHYICVIMCALTWKSRILRINLELINILEIWIYNLIFKDTLKKC